MWVSGSLKTQESDERRSYGVNEAEAGAGAAARSDRNRGWIVAEPWFVFCGYGLQPRSIGESHSISHHDRAGGDRVTRLYAAARGDRTLPRVPAARPGEIEKTTIGEIYHLAAISMKSSSAVPEVPSSSERSSA